MQKFYTFCIRFLQISTLTLFGILAIISFLGTAYIEEPYTYVIHLGFDNPLLNLLFLFCYLMTFLIIGEFFSHRKRGDMELLALACLWVFGISLLWIYFSKNGPIADGASVYYAAKQFAANDFSAVSYKGSYFSVYPFQYGLALFYEIIFRLARSDNFHILQGVNALCLIVCTISQYHLCGRFFHEKKAQIYTLLFTASCAPFIMYSSFIYGEIPSITFTLFGSWMLTLFLGDSGQTSVSQNDVSQKTAAFSDCSDSVMVCPREGNATERIHALSLPLRALCGILALLSISAGVLVRKNSLIFMIALGITATLWLIHNTNRFSVQRLVLYTAYFILLFSLSAGILPLAQNRYAALSGDPINSGVPAASYLAMGLSETEVGPGFYDGSNFKTFSEDADYDTETAAALAWEIYRERFSYFISHPAYSLRFFGRKFCAEWIDTGWAVFPATYNSYGDRLALAESLFSGTLHVPFKNYISNCQMALYIAAAFCVFSLFRRKKDRDVFPYLFPLTAFGGALFFLVWETSGRYILPYAIFMFPYAGYGVQQIFILFGRIFSTVPIDR